MRKPFATWTVGETDYKLKLTTSDVASLEEKFNTNLLNIIMGNGLPALSIMLQITHAAMKKYQHGIKLDAVYDLFDTYLDEGGSQTDFMTDVFIPIYQASGFLSDKMGEEMENSLEKAKENM